ncbi:hypothetical protein GW17_00031898 [Ensete ventricosum]|nr:hypothetical protein GW17_00031898 [Ensete ventricosum]
MILVAFGRPAYILKQDSLPSSYKSFLHKHCGKDAVILQGLREITSNIRFSNLDGVKKYYKSIGVDVKLDPNMTVPCSVCITFPTGLALLIEKKSKRTEISLYCLARAIESFCTCLADAGVFPRASKLKRSDVIVFSFATAIIMHCYAQERDVFRSKYLNVLDWVFGLPPPSDDEHCKKS